MSRRARTKYDNLIPHRELILSARLQGKSLSQIETLLKNNCGVLTSETTLHRFFKDHAPDQATRELTEDEEKRLETIALLTELMSMTTDKHDQMGLQIEHLAGKIELVGQQVEELERALGETPQSSNKKSTNIPTRILITIWLRALFTTGAIAALSMFGASQMALI